MRFLHAWIRIYTYHEYYYPKFIKIRVLESLQQFQDAYLASNASDQDNKTVFTFNTFAIKIQEIDTTNGFGGQSFSVNLGSVEDTTGINGTIPPEDLVTSDSAMDVSTTSTASIQLPNNLFESCGLSDNQTRLSYSVFLSDVLFQNETQIRDGLRVGSIILAPRLPCSKTLITPITVSFRTNQMVTIILVKFYHPPNLSVLDRS